MYYNMFGPEPQGANDGDQKINPQLLEAQNI